MRESIEKLIQIINNTTDYVSTYPFFCKGLNDFAIKSSNRCFISPESRSQGPSIIQYNLVIRDMDQVFYFHNLTYEEAYNINEAYENYQMRKHRWIEQQLCNYGIE